MQRSRISLAVWCVGMVVGGWGVLSLPALFGEDKPTLEPGFRSIFNGKDLTGWHKNPEKIGHGTGGHWSVIEGAITGEQDPPGSGNGGIILTDETFGDFEVLFETNPDWGPDSGFFMRSTNKGNCYQMMIDYHDNGNVGEVYREGLDGQSNRTFVLDGSYADQEKKQLQGIVASPLKPVQPDQKVGKPLIKLDDWSKIWKHGQWNTVRCKVVGNPPTITTWINGTKITEYVSDKKFEEVLRDTGHLAFQVHGGTSWPKGAKVRFRNVRVKPL
ncbi:MAG: DUF1080 domain-containing protein [Planctomycetales bacterium]